MTPFFLTFRMFFLCFPCQILQCRLARTPVPGDAPVQALHRTAEILAAVAGWSAQILCPSALWLLVPQQPHRTRRWSRDGLGSVPAVRVCHPVTRRGTAACPAAGVPALGLCRSTSAACDGHGLVAAGAEGSRGLVCGSLEVPPLGSCSISLIRTLISSIRT